MTLTPEAWICIAVNIFGAIMIGGFMLEITPAASISRSPRDAQAMWGMLRRLLYISITVGMAGRAFWVAEGWINPTWADVSFWCMVVIPIGLFVMIRYLGLVDQDRWVGLIGRQSYVERRRQQRAASN